MEKPKDKDYLKTEENLIFCVVGYLHPPEGFTAFLKYLPYPDGKWGRGLKRFKRALTYYHVTQVEATYELLEERYPYYLCQCPVRGIKLSIVPQEKVMQYYRPRDRLQTLMEGGPSDPLEERLTKLVRLLCEASELNLIDFGVTGSLLLKIHNPQFSDIDLTVHGLKASKRIREALRGGIDGIKAPPRAWLKDWCSRRVDRVHLSFEDLLQIAERRWSQGFYEGTYFSIHPVRTDDEIREEYGRRLYRRLGLVEGNAVMRDTHESLYTPAIYRVEDATIKGEMRGVSEVEEVVSFEGLYSGIFEEGEHIEFGGVLERVEERDKVYHRVVIGAADSGGGYIRFV